MTPLELALYEALKMTHLANYNMKRPGACAVCDLLRAAKQSFKRKSK